MHLSCELKINSVVSDPRGANKTEQKQNKQSVHPLALLHRSHNFRTLDHSVVSPPNMLGGALTLPEQIANFAGPLAQGRVRPDIII